MDKELNCGMSAQVNQKTCATCSFWQGPRKVELAGGKIVRVKFPGGRYPCIAKPGNQTETGVNQCSRWGKWEKLS